MKNRLCLLLVFVAASLAGLSGLTAQTAAPAATPQQGSAAPGTSSAQPSLLTGRKIVHVAPAAASTRMPSRLRASTAQAAAARGNPVPLKTLPSFAVKQIDGTATTVQALTHPTHWLLLYRQPHCVPCDRVMNTIAAGSSVEANQGLNLVIVVEGKDAARMLSEMHAKFTGLDRAVWVSAAQGEAKKALKVKGAPVLYAIDGSKIRWVLPGTTRTPAELNNQIASWSAAIDKPAIDKPVIDQPAAGAGTVTPTVVPAASAPAK